MAKDTRTRYQGVYARHKQGCKLEDGDACSCSPSFWGKVWDRGGGKHRKTRLLPTITAARSARTDLETSLKAGQLPVARSMRVDAATEAFLKSAKAGVALNKHRRPYKASAVRTLEGALNGPVKEAFGSKRLGDVRRADVQDLIDVLAARLSGSSVRRVVNAVRSLYAWAQDRELVDIDPAQRVRLPAMDPKPRDRIATPAEMARLLAALPILDALPFALACYATARRSEIRHMTLEDVDLALGVVYLGSDERGRKSRAAQRAVPIARPLGLILRRAALARKPSNGNLLCPGLTTGGRNSGMLSFEGLQTRADKAWAKAKLQRITAHECRHTAISWLDAAGVRHQTISVIAGHTLQHGGAQVTSRYTHSLPGDLEVALGLFDAYLASEQKEATG